MVSHTYDFGIKYPQYATKPYTDSKGRYHFWNFHKRPGVLMVKVKQPGVISSFHRRETYLSITVDDMKRVDNQTIEIKSNDKIYLLYIIDHDKYIDQIGL